ncbi:MAG: hypothetical protein K5686_04055 [Lachnospiraceae bacterium]|nr:hypothetical protein [Lachnospiraceae bacterium]
MQFERQIMRRGKYAARKTQFIITFKPFEEQQLASFEFFEAFVFEAFIFEPLKQEQLQQQSKF